MLNFDEYGPITPAGETAWEFSQKIQGSTNPYKVSVPEFSAEEKAALKEAADWWEAENKEDAGKGFLTTQRFQAIHQTLLKASK